METCILRHTTDLLRSKQCKQILQYASEVCVLNSTGVGVIEQYLHVILMFPNDLES